jgi:hypothetical protein
MIQAGPRLALRHRRKRAVALGVIAVALALSGLSIESASASTRSSLALSLSADRSNAVGLDGSTVKGNIYVFVKSSSSLDKVDFYVDGRWQVKLPVHTETSPPFDFAGTAASGVALPYDTTKLADGSHTIRAVLTRSDGRTSSRRGTFEVANSGATASPTASPTVSTTTPKAPDTASPTATTSTAPAATAAPTTAATASPTRTATTATPSPTRTATTATATPTRTATTATATPTRTATTTTATPTHSPIASTITHLPGQPAITAYGSSSAVTPFAHQGALIIVGRDNYADRPTKDASAAGATVLIYLDAIIDNPYGRYHEMLNNASECGPATSRWPGNYKANSWGYLNDFRVGSVLQSKLKCVLEKMVAENPHMGGFFADDLGSRSWFPGFNWDAWGATNQQSYRAGAIALAQTFHDVAAEHGLMVMVNGTWTAGSLASSGGGYPNMSSHGLALADGGYVEHHSAAELEYWTAYAQGQWATAAGRVSRGKPVMYVQASDAVTRDAYNRAGVFSFLSGQVDYDTASVWGAFHATGLPSRVAQ